MFAHRLKVQFSVKMLGRRAKATSRDSTDELNLFLDPEIVVSISYYISNDSAFSESCTSKLDSSLAVLKNQGFGTVWFVRC